MRKVFEYSRSEVSRLLLTDMVERDPTVLEADSVTFEVATVHGEDGYIIRAIVGGDDFSEKSDRKSSKRSKRDGVMSSREFSEFIDELAEKIGAVPKD